MRLVPSLADLNEDIAGEVPPDLIKDWLGSDQTPQTHARMLASFLQVGTVVSSDSAGLSKLSRERPLLEVLQLVNHPKEVLAAHALPIGGHPTGLWIADNTQTFFPSSVPVEDILHQMVAAMQEVAAGPLQIGLGIHHGGFVFLGRGVYGEDADFVEEVAENQTRGGEIILSQRVREMLGEGALGARCSPRQLDNMVERAHTLDYSGLRVPNVRRQTMVDIPVPFPRAFVDQLRVMKTAADGEALERRYSAQRYVVLAKVFHEPDPLLLNALSARAAANQSIRRLVPGSGVNVVKCNGDLGIFETETQDSAVRFSQALRQQAAQQGLALNVAVTRGEVLLFDMEDGNRDIVGAPVNMASKLAEDTPQRGRLFVEESAVGGRVFDGAVPFAATVSRVEIRGVSLP